MLSLGCMIILIVMNFLVHLSEFFHRPFQEWSRISQKGYCPGVYSLDGIPATEFCHSSEVHFFFISAYLMVFAANISKDLLLFFFPWVLILCWFHSIRGFSFPTFYYKQGTFFYAKFHSYMLAIYSYCFYQNLQLFFNLRKYLNIIRLHNMIHFSHDFSQICSLLHIPQVRCRVVSLL